MALLSSCEGPPARQKPWRHVKDPEPGSSPPSSPILAAEAERARTLSERADTLRVHLDADPLRLHPLLEPTEQTDRVVLGTVFETLVRCGAGPGATTAFAPGLATRWSPLRGGAGLLLELRPDVKFHDGSRMTPADVKFSLEPSRVRGGRGRAPLPDVATVELAGPSAVRIWQRRPNGYLLRALCERPIVPAAAYPPTSVSPRGPLVGSGPYRFEAWDDAVIRLVRNPDYWGARPAIGRIAFAIVTDDARAVTLARTGELDVLPALIPLHAGLARDAAVGQKLAPLALSPAGFDYLALSVERPPLDDVRVRQAISLALDRARLAGKDGGPPIAAPVWPGGPASGAAPPAPRHDPAAAIALLEQAGYVDRDGDGLRERGGERLQLVALVSDEPSAVREPVFAALRAVGFFVEARVGSPAVLHNRLRDGQFQVAFVSWIGPADGDLAVLFGAGGRDNFGRYRDAEVDRLLGAMQATFDPAERAGHAAALGARLADQLPIVPLWARSPLGLIDRRVRGARPWDGWLPLADLSLAPDVR